MKKLATLILLAIAMLIFGACQENTAKPENTVTYTITWIDENGEIISSNSVEENKIPSCNYSVSDTAEWDFTFEGWAASENGEVLSSIPKATANTTYYACVSAVKQKYTVTFHSNGGSSIESQTVEYGSKAALPEAPVYAEHKFIGWCYDAEGTNPVDFNKPITSNVNYYATWNEVVNVKELLVALLNGYELNPLSYIPETMCYDFSANLVKTTEIISDYSQPAMIENIHYGYGEQWHMVLDNLIQSKTFFTVLSVVEGVSATSISAFNNYFDNNPSDTAYHEFKNGIYNVTINFDGETIFFVLDYTAELPLLGEQTIQIALSMTMKTSEKNVRIQIEDANALTYKIRENAYEFAIKYAGVRRAMFSIERNEDGNVSGKIFEYLTAASAEIASAAEFYITDDYVSVVGNKASGIIGFTGYINELYNVETGKMIGYEVQETLSSIVYNTLWFNLKDISGINTIKYRAKDGDVPAAVFVNGATDEWEAQKVGGVGTKMFSRRFDIEFRTQYVYSYDASTEEYTEHKIEVPMLFVQEEFFETLADDVKSANNVNVSVLAELQDIEKLLEDYDTLIPIFISNKDTITVELILAYIGNKLEF
ncbi:MAG: InlB B-repeat-containing protein [Clostridia bacterium]|nr:InlB B-repeat-containing protein [Clostridia bacterium]